MTQYHYTPFIIPLVITVLFGVALLAVAWRNRAEPVALWFAATVAALLVWTGGYLFELTAVGLHAKLVWADLEYAATIALPLFWLQVVMILHAAPRSVAGTLGGVDRDRRRPLRGHRPEPR